MKRKEILSLCDLTGNMVEPWVKAGWKATIVDIQHNGKTREGTLTKIGCSVFDIGTLSNDKWGAVFAFPPCTDLANSGNAWKQIKGLPRVIEALQLVNKCRELCEGSASPYMIENPVGSLSTYWRTPEFRFDPYEYAGYLKDNSDEAYSKRTCLWVGGGFVMPRRKPVPQLRTFEEHVITGGGRDHGNQRSITPRGFARAVFLANWKLTLR